MRHHRPHGLYEPRWGRLRIKLTVPGMALTGGVALLAPPALESRDRLPIGVLAGILVLLVVNGVWARARLAESIRITSPDVASTGRPVELSVEVDGPGHAAMEVSLITARGVPWVMLRAGTATTLQHAGFPTGVYHHAVVEVVTSNPFGLVAVGRRAAVPIPGGLHVVPRAASLDAEVDLVAAATIGRTDDDEVVGLRERRSGDRLRDVDWSAVARTGRMIVRKRDARDTARVEVVVESIDPDPAALDRALLRAHSIGRRLLADGHGLDLTHCRQVEWSEPEASPDPDRFIMAVSRRSGSSVRTATTTQEQLAKLLAATTDGAVERPDGEHLLCTPDVAMWA